MIVEPKAYYKLIDENTNLSENIHIIFNGIDSINQIIIIGVDKKNNDILYYTLKHVKSVVKVRQQINEISIFKCNKNRDKNYELYLEDFKNGYISLLKLINSDDLLIKRIESLYIRNKNIYGIDLILHLKKLILNYKNIKDAKYEIENFFDLKFNRVASLPIYDLVIRCDIIIDRTPENFKNNTFDHITVDLQFIGKFDPYMNFEIFKSTIQNRKKDIDKFVIEKLLQNKNFCSYEVPVNFLKVDKIFITKKFDVIYTLSLKEI